MQWQGSRATGAVGLVALALLAAACGGDSSISVYIPRTRTPAAAAPTATATAPPLASATRTSAPTATGTAAPTNTASSPPTATRTPTSPPTRTATTTAVIPTLTSTATAIPPTATVTPPATNTSTAAATASHTATAPATASHTATAIPTDTIAITATFTASPVFTPTALPTSPAAASATPTTTFTATGLPSATFTATATPTGGSGAVCGNRVLEPGETCESCAADCVIGPCNAPGSPTEAFIVDLVQPTGFQPTTATVLLGYNSTKLSLPGTGTATTVRQRIVAPAPVPQAFTPNDKDYAVQVLISRNTPLGQLFTATFDRCSGSPAPTLADVSCAVLSCAQGGGGVAGCTCTVRLP
ncbi:hypothetical protein KF840_26580 [bacterium]|nr:hypothetical protein [bacterium]